MIALRQAPAMAAALLVAVATPASAAPPVDWNAVADIEAIEIVTLDADGNPRETSVPMAVWKGHGYVRTGRSGWLADVERDPDVRVRIAGAEHLLRAVRVRDSETYEGVTQAFREQEGLWDAFLGLFRGLRPVPTILRLDPRTTIAPAP